MPFYFFKKIKEFQKKSKQYQSFKFYKNSLQLKSTSQKNTFLIKLKQFFNFIQTKLKQIIIFLLKKIFLPSPRSLLWSIFILVLVLTILTGLVNYPTIPDDRKLREIPLKYLNLPSNKYLDYFRSIPFHLGLDLSGGAELIYEADLSQREEKERADALSAVRDIIERRVNAFGVSEPRVRTFISGDYSRIMVELPGISDIGQAIKMIGETPILEFRTPQKINWEDLPEEIKNQIPQDQELGDQYIPTELTGEHLKKAQVQFDQNTGQALVGLQFDDKGKEIFANLTKEYTGKQIAIYLDGSPISIPHVNEPILNGEAVITGSFTVEEARTLAKRLNAGALPVPVKLVAQNQVEATLGKESLDKSLKAGFFGIVCVILFMLVVYRWHGVLSVLALTIYGLTILAIFKLWPVTLTLAGIAGFILSIGMAVDANVLIFERMREEIKLGKSKKDAIEEGFRRAWPSIRDSNVSSLITCWILAWFGSSVIRGFAITLAIGILMSMFSAITVTRTFLRMLYNRKQV